MTDSTGALSAGLAPVHAEQLRQIVEAAGIDPAVLSTQGWRILRSLGGWDDWTIGGLIELLAATRRRERREPGR